MKFLKNLFIALVVVFVTAAIITPAFAGENETPMQKERRYLNRYHDDLERYHDSLRKKEQLLEQQQYAAPPAGEFVPVAPEATPAVVLVPRKYYYWDDYAGAYFGIYLDCYPWWTPPLGWGWYPWTSYMGIPVYGWVGGYWRGDRIVINNFNVSHRGFNRAAFSQRFNKRFGGLSGHHPRGHTGFSRKQAPNWQGHKNQPRGHGHTPGFGQQGPLRTHRGQMHKKLPPKGQHHPRGNFGLRRGNGHSGGSANFHRGGRTLRGGGQLHQQQMTPRGQHRPRGNFVPRGPGRSGSPGNFQRGSRTFQGGGSHHGRGGGQPHQGGRH